MTCWLCNQPTPTGLALHPECYRKMARSQEEATGGFIGPRGETLALFDKNGRVVGDDPEFLHDFSPGSEWGTWGDSGKSSEVYEWRN